jgi:uncharacterized membrane protein YdfJ with MMPL/SSD domain
VLRHRLLVVVFWVAVAAVGAVTVSATTGRMTQSFGLPGSPVARTNARILLGAGQTRTPVAAKLRVSRWTPSRALDTASR